MSALRDRIAALISLSQALGAEHRRLAILGEGNTAACVSEETFVVKASGSSLATLGEPDVVECQFAPLLALVERDAVTDQEIEDAALASRVQPNAKKPSIEVVFQAWLLSLPGVEFVAHTHPVAVNQILCSPRAYEFAERRSCPDEVVFCGAASVLVPYIEPGLRLAQGIRDATRAFIGSRGKNPRVILLQNHGIITLGASPEAVQAAMLMADKSAEIFAGAVALGGPSFLSPEDVHRLENRLDEQYRRRVLKL